MIYYTLLNPTDFLTNPVNYVLFAAARYGTNGDFYPAPEIVVGGPSEEDLAWSRRTWDVDLLDGMDSQAVDVALDADLGAGTATWDVEGADDGPISFSLGGGDAVGSVRIVAAAQVPGTVEWSDLCITFYDEDTQSQDHVAIEDGPAVDTTTSQTGVAEQALVVTPDSTTVYERVSVSGTFRMTHGPDTYPAPSDLFGQILVMPQAA